MNISNKVISKKIDINYRRCAICDFCAMGEPKESRHFTWDEVENEWHCNHCKKIIQEDLDETLDDGVSTYWLNLTERHATGDAFSHRVWSQETLPEAVDPLQARLNTHLGSYLDEEDGEDG